MDWSTTRVAPSGEQLLLTWGSLSAVVVTGGAGLRLLRAGDLDILDGYNEAEPCGVGRGQLLAPWPNRIRQGRFDFDGETHQVALTEPARGNAIHGFVRHHTWEVEEHGEARAVLRHLMAAQPGYPWVLHLRTTYVLDDAGLQVTQQVRNCSAAAAPYGSGAHPYLRAGTERIDSCELTIPAATWLQTDDQQIPLVRRPVAGSDYDFRAGRALGSTSMDTAFTDLRRDADGCWRVRLRNPAAGVTVSLWADAAHPCLMVFTGDPLGERARHGLGVEPMTCAPNAFQSGDGLRVLQPGEEFSASWGISIEGDQ